jgi:UDP-glucuronate decarboxylase
MENARPNPKPQDKQAMNLATDDMIRTRMTAQQVILNDLNEINHRLTNEFSVMAGKTLFISGAAGFLGHYLVQAVLHWNQFQGASNPIQVIACDNFMRGVPKWLTKWADDPFLSLMRHDIRDPFPDQLHAIDYFIHAASIASPTYYRRFPIETMDANVSGLRILLERAKSQKEAGKPISGFLYFSTSEIYGDPLPHEIPTVETYRGNVSCNGPRACYDESKRYGETLCANFAQQYSLPITIVRPFNNYGPGLKITDRRVIADLARDVFAGKNLVLHSNGSPTRTFCYVSDAIIGYYQTLIHGVAGNAYNIGSERPEVSILSLANLISKTAADLIGYAGDVIYTSSTETDYLTDNPQRRCPNIQKAREAFGFQPKVSLEEGLRRTLIWYRENQEAEDS